MLSSYSNFTGATVAKTACDKKGNSRVNLSAAFEKSKTVNTGAKHVKKKSPINISVHVHGSDFLFSVRALKLPFSSKTR